MSVTSRSLRNALFALLAVVVAVAGMVTAGAADEPENVLKYRQSVMKSHAAHIGAIAAVVKGEVSYGGHVAAHARALHALSMMLPDIFPEGSAVGASRAKPEIWQDRAKFDAAVKGFQTATGELATVAEGGDLAAIGAKLEQTGKACGACHKPFRAKKQ